jgi:DNA-binding NtrC family response regulator
MITVLIVDDNDEQRSILSDLLTGYGYSIDEAPSGEEAIEKAALSEFDIVLLDLVMPKMSGMDVLSEIRKTSPQTKIIIMTGFATVEGAVEAIKKGASDYIAKPFNSNTLNVIIRRIQEEKKFDTGTKKLKLDSTLRSLSCSIRRQIIKLIDSQKGMKLMEITRVLNIDDHTKVYFHLKILRNSKIIEQKNKTYILTREGDELLSRLRILENNLLQ